MKMRIQTGRSFQWDFKRHQPHTHTHYLAMTVWQLGIQQLQTLQIDQTIWHQTKLSFHETSIAYPKSMDHWSYVIECQKSKQKHDHVGCFLTLTRFRDVILRHLWNEGVVGLRPKNGWTERNGCREGMTLSPFPFTHKSCDMSNRHIALTKREFVTWTRRDFDFFPKSGFPFPIHLMYSHSLCAFLVFLLEVRIRASSLDLGEQCHDCLQ